MRSVAWLCTAVLAGCAPLFHADRPRPEVAFDNALLSLDQGDFSAAYENLSWIHEHYWERSIGERALLALTAVELDPRNPGRRLGVAAELGARFDDLPRASAWNAPVAGTLQLLALELAALEARIATLEAEKARLEREREEALAVREAARREVARAADRARRAEAEAAAAQPRAAPAPATSAAREAELRRERDRLANEVQVLRRSLAEQQRELERIRQTLSP